MEKANLNQLFQQADEELGEARKELYQPVEDVVNYSVCVFARRALYRFLKALYMLYAKENGDPIKDHQTLEHLLKYCGKYNDQIKSVDFSEVHCKCKELTSEDDNEIFYCNDVRKVKYCTELAEKVKELVLEKAGKNLLLEL